MKTLLLLGGMTPDVTALYYNLINAHVRSCLGKRHSAKLYIYSVDLETQLSRVQSGDWTAFADEFISGIAPLTAGPPILSPSANARATPTQSKPAVQGVALSVVLAHKVSRQISASLPASVPFLDITGFVAAKLAAQKPPVKTIGLIGPMVTMVDKSKDFFAGKLRAEHGIDVLVPDTEEERIEVNRGMLEEVVKGRDHVKDTTKEMFRRAADGLIERGAKALVLGSTDLGFVLRQEDFDEKGVLVLDAAKVHAVGLAEWMLEE